MEDISQIVNEAEVGMKGSIAHLEKAFNQIRAGKANPSMVGSVMVDYYGNPTPITQVANVSAPDAMTISIQPWEKNIIPDIERAIMIANLGFNPSNNGESVIINVPPLTKERRAELAKQAKSEVEKAKVSIRNWRKEANTKVKNSDASEDLQKGAESDIQKLTDEFVKEADAKFTQKESEIMTI